MSPPDEPRPERDRTGDIVLEHYRLDALIGRGGVGVVYRAVDTRGGQAVAVKIMREDILRVRTAAAPRATEPSMPWANSGFTATSTPFLPRNSASISAAR